MQTCGGLRRLAALLLSILLSSAILVEGELACTAQAHASKECLTIPKRQILQAPGMNLTYPPSMHWKAFRLVQSIFWPFRCKESTATTLLQAFKCHLSCPHIAFSIHNHRGRLSNVISVYCKRNIVQSLTLTSSMLTRSPALQNQALIPQTMQTSQWPSSY